MSWQGFVLAAIGAGWVTAQLFRVVDVIEK